MPQQTAVFAERNKRTRIESSAGEFLKVKNGKVRVINKSRNHKRYIVIVGSYTAVYKHEYKLKNHAYGDAKSIRDFIKKRNQPDDFVKFWGYKPIYR
jgi:hypothetical protein